MKTARFSVTENRVWYLDILRIAAAMGIVMLHLSPLGGKAIGLNSLGHRIIMSYSILFRWSVPVFLMISGALFLSPERKISIPKLYRKSVLRIVCSFFAWSFLYALTYCVITGKGKWTFLNQFLRGHYHMWYLFTIFALYVLTPLLKRMTESKEAVRYFLVLGFIFSFLFPRLISFALMFDIPHADVIRSVQSAITQANPMPGVHALYYYVLGHALHACMMKKRNRVLVYTAGIVGYVLAVELTLWHSNRLGEGSAYFYDLSSLLILAMAAAVFLFSRHAFSAFKAKENVKHLIIRLSAYSYGVYLVHPFLIEHFPVYLSESPLCLLAGIPLLVFMYYSLSMLISFILNSIPVLSKYIV